MYGVLKSSACTTLCCPSAVSLNYDRYMVRTPRVSDHKLACLPVFYAPNVVRVGNYRVRGSALAPLQVSPTNTQTLTHSHTRTHKKSYCCVHLSQHSKCFTQTLIK